METLNSSLQATIRDNPENCQDAAKTGKRAGVRSGMGTANYWKGRLYRNTYHDRSGQTVEVPEWYVRMRYAGVTRQIRLDHSSRESAAEQALQLFTRLQEQGWKVINDRKAHLPSSPTIEEFCEAYKTATKEMRNAPRPISIAGYIRHLKQICTLAGVQKVRDLTPEAIERAVQRYRMNARAEKRSDSATQNSLSIILRNAGAMFSERARAGLAKQGFILANPFQGIERGQKIEPVTPLDGEIVKRIWEDLPKLRNGDPSAKVPDFARFAKRYKKAHSGNRASRLPIDFSGAHKGPYLAILLALGAGLRANEIDKARWSWVKFDREGNPFLEIRDEADFKPKGGSLRMVPLDPKIYRELEANRDFASPYLLGGHASKSQKGWGYRSRETFRVSSDWLRAHGVSPNELRGNPLHDLRRQFGSTVASQFGLFYAQKMLGHASPNTTSAYYAGMTSLPQLTHVHLVG
jgi:integrase